jgi:hypothetical protein
VTTRINGLFECPHILMLFQIDPVVREKDIETIEIEPHGAFNQSINQSINTATAAKTRNGPQQSRDFDFQLVDLSF